MVPIEFMKELSPEQLAMIQEIINRWWAIENIPEDILTAKVVLIFKKGNKEDIGNNRPISLLNTMYKILAVIIKDRMAQHLDQHIQETQYGFRSKKGTADALQYIKRIVERGEATLEKY